MLVIEDTEKSRPLFSAMVWHSSSVRCGSQSMIPTCSGCTGGGGVGGDGADGGGDGSAGGGDGGGDGGATGGVTPQMQCSLVCVPQFGDDKPPTPTLNHTSLLVRVSYTQPRG